MSLRCVLALAHGCLSGDELSYLRMAQTLVGARPGDLALTEPILFPVLVSAVHFAVPDWAWAGRGLSLAAACALLVVLPLVSKAVFRSPWSGVGAGLVVACYPPLIDLSARALTEPLYDFLIMLAAWQTWRTLQACDSSERSLFAQAVAMSVPLAMLAMARREGILYPPLLAGLVLVTALRRRKIAAGIASAAACGLLTTGLLTLGHHFVQQSREAPSRYPHHIGLILALVVVLLVAILTPGKLLPKSLKPDDRRICTFFASLLLPAVIILLFPEPSRKATAFVPILALLASEGVRRMAHNSLLRAACLQLALTACIFLQGLSAPMRLYTMPPWRDRTDIVEAAEWLTANLGQTDKIAAYDGAINYYGSLNVVPYPPYQSMGEYLKACRKTGITYLVVDGHSELIRFPLLHGLAEEPANRPGLELVRVFHQSLNPIGQELSWLKQSNSQLQVAVYRLDRE